MIWHSIQISKQNVKAETDSRVLIRMPSNSDYSNYVFWHPAKLVRNGKHSNAISISYTDEFVFRLKKYGNGKYNKFDIIDEQEIDVCEFENAFEITNDNIIAPKDDTESYLIVKEPEKVDKEIEVLGELKNV